MIAPFGRIRVKAFTMKVCKIAHFVLCSCMILNKRYIVWKKTHLSGFICCITEEYGGFLNKKEVLFRRFSLELLADDSKKPGTTLPVPGFLHKRNSWYVFIDTVYGNSRYSVSRLFRV